MPRKIASPGQQGQTEAPAELILPVPTYHPISFKVQRLASCSSEAQDCVQAGLRKAASAVKAAGHAASCDANSDASGEPSASERPGLPRHAIDQGAAALQLESARVMRHANPGLESAECAFVEVNHSKRTLKTYQKLHKDLWAALILFVPALPLIPTR